MKRALLPILVSLAAIYAATAYAASSYVVDVWANVLFDESGKAKEVTISEPENHPAAFISAVRTRLEKARIEPRQLNAKPATFRTGVMITFEVSRANSSNGTVRLLGLQMAPLPIKQAFVGYPEDIAAVEGWTGSVTATCIVTKGGVCGQVTVKAVPGIPESARRFAKASLELWEFEPQRVGDVAVEGEYTLKMNLLTEGNAPEDFRQDKFYRAIRGK